VLDDGTTARLGEKTTILMTTTTAAAGLVMRHLDFVQQAFCAGWDLRFISVTEQLGAVRRGRAQGARAAELASRCADRATCPSWACGTVRSAGVEARLFRISFSGEEGYEIAVPTRYGEALFRDLLARAETMGGGAYGMEALNVLRIEKGFITHAEIHGRTTAFDIGMEKMVSAKKDCIGKAAASARAFRAGARAAGRAEGHGPDHAGAHLFTGRQPRARERSGLCHLGLLVADAGRPGWGLGFLKDGRARHGETIRLVDHLRGIDVLCEVCDPVFHDLREGRCVPELIAKGPLDGVEPLVMAGLTLAPVEDGPITSIALLPGGAKAAAKALKPLGLAFPGPGGISEKAGLRLVWTGRDQAFLFGDLPAGLEGAAVVTDQSGGWAGVTLTGPGAARALGRLVANRRRCLRDPGVPFDGANLLA
jgi:glycine cleavage system aminomethyltransferase T